MDAQFRMIENLAVENDPEGAVFIANGLLPAAEVNDAQTSVTQTDVVIEVNAKLVRAAVPDHGQHLPQRAFRRGIRWLNV
jgi:hypothetical protein